MYVQISSFKELIVRFLKLKTAKCWITINFNKTRPEKKTENFHNFSSVNPFN